jgi:hypothetical protein
MRSTARREGDERGERRDFATDRYRFDSVIALRSLARRESLGAASVRMSRMDTAVF